MQLFTPHKELLKKIAFVIVLVLCATPYINAPIALVLGFLFSCFIGHPFSQYNHKATNWLLKIAVVGLGFGMNFYSAMQVGKEGLKITFFSICAILILGIILGKILKINSKTVHLVSSGTAICGGSAIAAIAPVVQASEKDMSVALGTVFALNSIALILFPIIGHSLNLSQYQFGLWSAIAIQDTSSVVGAAASYGKEALSIATTVKLARALWII
ncbi:MAG: YeiH family protein, partial [Chitinophagaceae bacterium]